MEETVRECLNNPDEKKQFGTRFMYIKSFDKNIGLLPYEDGVSNTVKLIFKRSKRFIHVITAYPIA